MSAANKSTSNLFPVDQLRSSLPSLQRRKALLVIDAQNDFLSESATLAVETPPSLVKDIGQLVSLFRGQGQTIWVISEFESERLANDVRHKGESIILEDQVREFEKLRDGTESYSLNSASASKSDLSLAQSERSSRKSLALGNGATESTESLFSIANQADKEAFLSFGYDGSSPSICLPDTAGAKLAEGIQHLVDDDDLIVTKTHYSAFKSTALLSHLRSSIVTDIYLCGVLSNISIYATALDAAKHGLSITIVRDCVGYRDKLRHEVALTKMVDYMGADVRGSTELFLGQSLQRPTSQMDVKIPPRSSSYTTKSDIRNILASQQAEKGPGLVCRKPKMGRLKSKKSKQPKKPKDTEKEATTNGGDDSKSHIANGVEKRNGEDGNRSKRADSQELPSAQNDSALDDSTKTPDSVHIKSTLEGITREPQRNAVDIKSLNDNLNELSLQESPSPTFNVLKAVSATLEEVALNPRSFSSKSTATVSLTPSNIETAMAQTILPVHRHRVSRTHIRGQSLPTLGPNDVIAEGDSRIVYGLLPPSLSTEAFERVRDEVKWQTMYHRGGEVPRLVAVEGDIDEDGSFPIYRHPADESPALLQFSKTVSLIKKEVEKVVKHPVNHVLIQHYRNGGDNISEHSDKTLDIARGSSIVNVSLGALRVMTLRTKKSALIGDSRTPNGASGNHTNGTVPSDQAKGPLDELKSPENSSDPSKARNTQRVPMPHNSMFVLGEVSNMKWLHGIRPDKRPLASKTDDERAYDGERISLTFRLIGTHLSKDSSKIWGQGATSKAKNTAKKVVNGDTYEAEQMIRAFGAENHRSKFDWDAEYGEGFDVLNITTASPKLFASGDRVVDSRVKICLAEKGLMWDFKPAQSSKGTAEGQAQYPLVKFIDHDVDRSEIEGDLAILLYLETYCVSNALLPPMEQRSAIATVYSRAFASDNLRNAWGRARAILKDFQPSEAAKFLMSRQVQQEREAVVSPFRAELESWEKGLARTAYVATDSFTMADCAFWPVLHEIATQWVDWSEAAYPALAGYLKKVSERESVKLMLSEYQEKKE